MLESKKTKFIAAAVQAAPVFLNRQGCLEKAALLIEKAAGEGAKLIALPEVFIPARNLLFYLIRES